MTLQSPCDCAIFHTDATRLRSQTRLRKALPTPVTAGPPMTFATAFRIPLLLLLLVGLVDLVQRDVDRRLRLFDGVNDARRLLGAGLTHAVDDQEHDIGF